MTPQEEQLLNALVERVNQTQLQEKDPDAEALLNGSLGPNPDALYILAQTVLVQNIALEQAKAQVTQLQQQTQQARQPAHATSFLGSLLGHRDPEPPRPAYQPVNPQFTQAAVHAGCRAITDSRSRRINHLSMFLFPEDRRAFSRCDANCRRSGGWCSRLRRR